MNDTELRLKAIEIAALNTGSLVANQDIVASARRIYDFVRGNAVCDVPVVQQGADAGVPNDDAALSRA